MEPKVPAPANTKPEMTISLTPDRQQDIYNLVAKAYAQTQAAAAKPISTDTSLRTADPAQTSGLQAASKSSLPRTSSSSSVLYSLFGCTFVALAGLFIKKNKKD